MSGPPSVDVLIISDCGGAYGTERCNHALLMGLHERGFRVHGAQPGGPNTLVEERQRAGIATTLLAADDPWGAVADHPTLEHHSEYQALIEATQPKSVLFSGISPFSLLAGREVATAVGLPFATIAHLPVVQWQVGSSELAALRQRALRVEPASRATIAVSEATLRRLRGDFGLGIDNGVVIRNGRPNEWFELPDPVVRERVRLGFGVSPETVVFVTVGRAERAKGYHLLLPAAERLLATDGIPPVLFLWVGGGERLARLRAVVRSRGLGDQLQILGWRDDVRALLAGADVFVLPSLVEGMPLALIEAMASGLPVVAAAVDGIPEVLGATGRLVNRSAHDAENVESLYEALLAMVLTDSSTRRSLGDACRVQAGEFREDRMVESYARLVTERLLGGASG